MLVYYGCHHLFLHLQTLYHAFDSKVRIHQVKRIATVKQNCGD